MVDCIYLRDLLPGKTNEEGTSLYGCLVHEICTKSPSHDTGIYPSCHDCKDRLDADSPAVASDFVDHLHIMTRDRRPTDALRGLLAGRPAFLVCGGPSAKQLPLSDLAQPGCWSLAVNNMAGHYRPNAFVCGDPPGKFHEGIWRDPGIMKFVPTVKLHRKRGRLRCKLPDGTFERLKLDGVENVTVQQCPNVWGFGRRSWMCPDESFFTEPEAAWGNQNNGVKRTGEKKTVCTPLMGLRLLYYLGARRVYLVGVDFFMDPDVDLHDNYAFAEERSTNAVASNNSQFRVVNEWLCRMQTGGVFEKFGLEIFNVNECSGLRAFPHVPFDVAIKDARHDWPSEPYSLSGWYKK